MDEIPVPNTQAQIENLYSIIRAQQKQLSKLHQALVGHQAIFEAMHPQFAAAAAGKGKQCQTSN